MEKWLHKTKQNKRNHYISTLKTLYNAFLTLTKVRVIVAATQKYYNLESIA